MAKKAKTTKEKRPIGRPTKYKPEFCEEIIKYFDQPLYIYEEEERMSASGAVKIVSVKRANDMPTFEGFAVDVCKCDPDKLSIWAKKHEDFRGAMKKAKGLQKKFLFNHTINGNYNASFAKFFAINCLDMVDRSEVKSENEHNVKGYGLAFDLKDKPE